MNLMNEHRTQTKDQHNDECDDNHLPTGDQREREDQEESNVTSKHNWREDIDH